MHSLLLLTLGTPQTSFRALLATSGIPTKKKGTNFSLQGLETQFVHFGAIAFWVWFELGPAIAFNISGVLYGKL